jgi:hypothetical protein
LLIAIPLLTKQQKTSYTDIPAGEYLLTYTYMNRGNTSEDIGWQPISATLNCQSLEFFPPKHYCKFSKDQVHTFRVSLNVTAPYALDETTLSINVGLSDPNNVVSYNAFNGAYVYFSGAPEYAEYAGAYGGTGNFSYQYDLQAEGYNLKYLLDKKKLPPAEYAAYPGANLTDPCLALK